MDSAPFKSAPKKPEHLQGISLGVIMANLALENKEQGKRHVPNSPREYVVSEIDKTALQSMATLPYECTLAKFEGRTTLLTGTKGTGTPRYPPGTAADPRYEQKRIQEEAKFTLHNHPNQIGGMSQNDFHFSHYAKSEMDFIVTKRGITCFKIGEKEYADSIGQQWKGYPESGLGMLLGGRYEVRAQLSKGAIASWIAWEDPRVDLLCEFLNGRREWKDVSAIVLEKS
jgi:hypothetical protein